MSEERSTRDTEIDIDEHIRRAAIEATNRFLYAHMKQWKSTGGELDVDALSVRASETHADLLHVRLRSGQKERELLCPLRSVTQDPTIDSIVATLVPENVLFTQADVLLLLAGAALVNQHPVQTLYKPFREVYRAHPDGKIEIVEDEHLKRVTQNSP